MGEKLTPEQKAVEELIVTERGKVRGFLHSVLFIRILWLSLLLLCSPALLLPPHCRLLLSWYLGACLTRTWILLLPSPSLSLKCLCAMKHIFILLKVHILAVRSYCLGLLSIFVDKTFRIKKRRHFVWLVEGIAFLEPLNLPDFLFSLTTFSFNYSSNLENLYWILDLDFTRFFSIFRLYFLLDWTECVI